MCFGGKLHATIFLKTYRTMIKLTNRLKPYRTTILKQGYFLLQDLQDIDPSFA